MAKAFAKSFYLSAAWIDCRLAYIASVFGRCELCHHPIGTGGILHHKISLNPDNINNPEVTLNWNHLMYLCIKCHNLEHSHTGALRNDVMFDEFGNLVKRQ